MPRGFISELEQAAADVHNLSSVEVSRVLDRAIDMVRELRKQAPGDPIGQGTIIVLRTASAGAARLSEEETVHVLLDAAEAIRVLLANRKAH